MEISYPDPLHPEYSRRLKAATVGSNIVEAHADVPTINMCGDQTSKIGARMLLLKLREEDRE